jgi:hypothetical protein
VLKFLRRLFCDHVWEWRRNLYGDQIHLSGGNRSLWCCVKCDKWAAFPFLHNDPPGVA